ELNGLAVGQHQGIAESTDGGLTWNSLYGGPGSAQTNHPNLEGLAFKPNGLTGVAVGSCATNGFVYKLTFTNGAWDVPSTSNGKIVTISDSDWRFLGVDYADLNHFWACGWELQ